MELRRVKLLALLAGEEEDDDEGEGAVRRLRGRGVRACLLAGFEGGGVCDERELLFNGGKRAAAALGVSQSVGSLSVYLLRLERGGEVGV